MSNNSEPVIVYKPVPIETPSNGAEIVRRDPQAIMRGAMTLAGGAELVRVIVAQVVQVGSQIVVDLVVHTAVAITRGRVMYEVYVGMAKDRAIEIAQVQIRDPQLRKQVIDKIRRV